MWNFKRTLFLILYLGFYSIVFQTVLARELFTLFRGNEISFSFFFLFWMAGFSLGFYTQKFIPIDTDLLLIIAPVYEFLMYVLFIIVRKLSGSLTGPQSGLPLLVLIVFIPLVLLLYMPGALLGRAMALIQRFEKRGASILYVIEATGSLLGGLIFYLILAGRVSHFGIIILTLLPLILLGKKKFYPVAIPFLVLFFMSGPLEEALYNFIEPDYSVTLLRDTKRGKIFVLEREGEFVLYENGEIVASQVPDLVTQEEIMAYLGSFSKKPKVLFLCGGLSFDLNQLSEFSSDFYVTELDPEMINLYKKVLNPDLSPKVKLVGKDPVHYIKTTRDSFDVVIMVSELPVSLIHYRLLTLDNIRIIKEHLKDGGLLLVMLPFEETFPDPFLRKVHEDFWATMKSVFGNPYYLLGEHVTYISRKPDFATIKKVVENINFQRISWMYFVFRMRDMRKLTPGVPMKFSDPGVLKKSILFEEKKFSRRPLFLYYFALGVFLLLVIYFSIASFPSSALFAIFTTGIFSMVFDLFVMNLIQFKTGLIYSQLVLVLTLFHVGLSLGAYAGYKLKLRSFTGVDFGIWTISIVALTFYYIPSQFLFIVVFFIAFFTGFQFSVVNRYFLQGEKLYLFDILGGLCGTLIFLYSYLEAGILGVVITVILFKTVSFLRSHFRSLRT